MDGKRRFKYLRNVMTGICLFIGALIAACIVYVQHPKFGKAPGGERLERIKLSPNYKNGKFENLHYTPMVSKGHSLIGVAFNFIFKNFPRTRPKDIIPSVKTDLRDLPVELNLLIWFGHSSYYIQLDKKRFLIDPVFSKTASPLPNSNKSFKGTDLYLAEDMPEIDYLIISHDHFDHLDYPTINKLRSKIKNVVCGLGVGSHFEHWQFDMARIKEQDWNDSLAIGQNFTVYTTPTRHFSGRSLSGNNTLWASYVLAAPSLRIYLGGDSGYDMHFAEIGQRFGGFDLAILENGQSNEAWHEIHLLPDEVIKASQDLRAKRLMPVHSSKFSLAFHPWDEPLKKLTSLNEKTKIPLVTPVIGEIVYLDDESQKFTHWWAGLD